MSFVKIASHLIVSCLFCTRLCAQHWVDFEWMGATVDGREFKKAAILLPVQLSGLKGHFVAQFDLGSDISELYGNAIRNYYPGREALFQTLDTLHRSTSDNGTSEYPVIGIQAKTGEYAVSELYLADGFGDDVPKDSLYTPSAKLVGTIGASFTKNKVLIIDFPRHRMALLDSVDGYWSRRTDFVGGRIRKGRFQLPFTIRGQISWLLFDTGASIFPLAVDSGLWRKITGPKVGRDTLHISSWGETVPYYGAEVTTGIYLGGVRMPKAEAWYTANKRLTEFNRQEEIAGLTGNAYFLNDIIVIDFKNNRFGIVK
jgi:hypothetical protein